MGQIEDGVWVLVHNFSLITILFMIGQVGCIPEWNIIQFGLGLLF